MCCFKCCGIRKIETDRYKMKSWHRNKSRVKFSPGHDMREIRMVIYCEGSQFSSKEMTKSYHIPLVSMFLVAPDAGTIDYRYIAVKFNTIIHTEQHLQ